MEVLTAVLIPSASLVLQCWIKPWRAQAVTAVDAAVTFLIILCCAVVICLVSLELKGSGQVEEEGCNASEA